MAVVIAVFVDFEITWRADVFSGAPQESSAANYGTVGINFKLYMTLDRQAFEHSHIPGSIHLDNIAEVVANLLPEEEIVVYCPSVQPGVIQFEPPGLHPIHERKTR